jgi:starch synthase
MKLLMASSECAPFFKTGGFGDVIEALPKALKKCGCPNCIALFFTSILAISIRM